MLIYLSEQRKRRMKREIEDKEKHFMIAFSGASVSFGHKVIVYSLKKNLHYF